MAVRNVKPMTLSLMSKAYTRADQHRLVVVALGYFELGKPVTRFLNEQYLDVSNKLYRDKLITDETRFGVLAIEDMENSTLAGKKYMYKYMQGPQAAYLKRAGEILGLDFPLPEDPEKW